MARSEVNRIYDADTKFRAPGSAAVTATAVVGVLPLDLLSKTHGAQKGKLASEGYEVVVVVSALDLTSADETYTFTVEVGSTGGADVVVGTLAVKSTGQFVIALDGHTIEKLEADPAEIELNVTLAGTTPSITFSAWLAYGVGH